MKNRLPLLLLVSTLFLSVGCGSNKNSMKPDEPKEIDVVIISGQSNGVGCTHSECVFSTMGEKKYREYFSGYEDMKISYDCWTKDWVNGEVKYYSQNSSKNTFVNVKLGQGNGLGTFGPEIGISESLHEEYGKRLFLIKFACGASNLKDDWLKKDSAMYTLLARYVRTQMENLKNDGYIPTIKAFCWMQGEGDAYDGYYQFYLQNLREFVGNLREDFREYAGNKDLPFIDAGISDAYTNGAYVWQYYKEVNQAKADFAAENEANIFIDTIAAGLHTNQEPFSGVDYCHYDSDSQIQLGHLFADNFKQFLAK